MDEYGMIKDPRIMGETWMAIDALQAIRNNVIASEEIYCKYLMEKASMAKQICEWLLRLAEEGAND